MMMFRFFSLQLWLWKLLLFFMKLHTGRYFIALRWHRHTRWKIAFCNVSEKSSLPFPLEFKWFQTLNEMGKHYTERRKPTNLPHFCASHCVNEAINIFDSILPLPLPLFTYSWKRQKKAIQIVPNGDDVETKTMNTTKSEKVRHVII